MAKGVCMDEGKASPDCGHSDQAADLEGMYHC